MNIKHIRTAWAALALTTGLGLAGCERPPMTSSQNGYRGVAMGQVENPRIVEPLQASQTLPAPVPAIPSPEGSPLAKDIYKNVQVLGDLPSGEFTRTMLAITAWVSPKEGCAYCHAAGAELSEDKLYTKIVARKMLQMTRHINADWQKHVGNTGVTCYTCHRGQPVPEQIWTLAPPHRQAGGTTPDAGGQNHPSMLTGVTSLGVDQLARYLLRDEPIRVESQQALPVSFQPGRNFGEGAGIRQTENTFGLMVHMSKALGVNCTFCHNTRAVASWEASPLQRTTAYHGIRMARDLNNAYLVPLTDTFPVERLGPLGDVAKVNCATCHQGQNKPLNGALLLKDHSDALGGMVKAMSMGGDAATPMAQAPQADATAAPAADAPAPATAPEAASGLLGQVLFDTGDTSLSPAAQQVVADAAALLKRQPEVKVALSGFADSTGNQAQNLELAKLRAQAVQKALADAGVAAERVELKRPETAVAGTSADSRRVEINAQP